MLSFEEKTYLKLWEIFPSQIFVAYICDAPTLPLPLPNCCFNDVNQVLYITHVLQVVSLTSKDYEVVIHIKNSKWKFKKKIAFLFTLALSKKKKFSKADFCMAWCLLSWLHNGVSFWCPLPYLVQVNTAKVVTLLVISLPEAPWQTCRYAGLGFPATFPS